MRRTRRRLAVWSTVATAAAVATVFLSPAQPASAATCGTYQYVATDTTGPDSQSSQFAGFALRGSIVGSVFNENNYPGDMVPIVYENLPTNQVFVYGYNVGHFYTTSDGWIGIIWQC